MKRITTIFGVFFCMPLLSIIMAQTHIGTVSDNRAKPLKYVNIGIVDGNNGTISDLDGNFIITLPDNLDAFILRFSRVGYQTLDITVADFKLVIDGRVTLMPLESEPIPKPFEGSKYSVKNISGRGMRIPGGVFSIGYYTRSGAEIGNVISNKGKFIPKSIELTVLSCEVDTVLFRLNIYRIDEHESVRERINSSEIYLSVLRSKRRQSYQLDLEPQKLELKGEYYFGLEYISSTPLDKETKDGIYLYIPTHSGRSYMRENSHGNFMRYSLSFGMVVDAWVSK